MNALRLWVSWWRCQALSALVWRTVSWWVGVRLVRVVSWWVVVAVVGECVEVGVGGGVVGLSGVAECSGEGGEEDECFEVVGELVEVPGAVGFGVEDCVEGVGGEVGEGGVVEGGGGVDDGGD